MKIFRLSLISLLMLGLAISACKKNDNGEHNTITPGSVRSLEEAIYSAAPIAKTTSIIVSIGAVLRSSNGTVFYFPPNAFETLTGGKVTGSVDVTFNDWTKKGDMVFGKVLPLNYGKVMLSAGESFIQISQNGNILRMKKGVHCTIAYPQFGVTGPFYSGWVGRTLEGSANNVNWLPKDTGLLLVAQIGDTVYVRADTLHYNQVADSLNVPGYCNFTVNLKSPVVLEQSMAVALIDDKKSIYPVSSAINGRINAIQVPQMPIHFAVMGINAGQFYSGIVAIPNPATDSTYDVTIKLSDPASTRQSMNSL